MRKATTILMILAVTAIPSARAGDVEAPPSPWTIEDSPVVLTEDYVVIAGETLEIEPGVEVRVGPGVSIVVHGVVKAEGTSDAPISFSAAEAEPWEGMFLLTKNGAAPPDYQTELEHVRFSGAVRALKLAGTNPRVTDVHWEDNDTAVSIRNPQGPSPDSVSAITQSSFIQNRVAVKGWTYGEVAILSSDFWDNRVNLHARTSPPWDCRNDEGTWTIHGNDILRGPDQPFYSFDIRTSEGAGSTDLTVTAVDNWWGSIERADIRARTKQQLDCCPGPDRADIALFPASAQPNTTDEPPGEVNDPEPPGDGHSDPGGITTITSPRDGRCLADRDLTVRGNYNRAVGGSFGDMRVGLIKKERDGCKTWSEQSQRLVAARSCGRPQWLEPTRRRGTSDGWKYHFGRLPAGRYVARSEALEPDHTGRNVIRFRLTRS